MSLYDRLVPAEALRWGRLTAVWPWQPVRPHLDLVAPPPDPQARPRLPWRKRR